MINNAITSYSRCFSFIPTKSIDTKIKILSQNSINQKHKLKLINLPKNNEEEASQIYKLLHYKLIAKREKFK